MTHLVLQLVRPYRAGLAVVFAAMLVETLMSRAAPWPLKIVLDNALGHHPLPGWLGWEHDLGLDRDTMGLALFAALATVIIAAIGALASYIDNYYTESVGQWVAHDLRMRIYDHLHRLSTIRQADKIIVLEAGKVAEEGTHDVLMQRNGPYAALYRVQFPDAPDAGTAPVAAATVAKPEVVAKPN